MLSARSLLRALLLSALVSLPLMLSTRPAAGISGRTVFTRVGTGASDQFGLSVAFAGDFDADGQPDVIMGAPFNDGGGGSSGRAYLGSLIFTGAAGEELGYSVASAGDFNGDGFDDLIIGAPLGAATNGRAYIYYGGPSPNTTADLTLTGLVAGDFFGGSVAGAGDVNGDGFDDVIVGAQNADPGALASAGQAYVFYGGNPPNNVADITMNGTFASDFFGTSVSGAGDFNQDGFDDVIVGASSSDVVGLNLGAAFVFYGGAVANSTADVTLGGEFASDNFGSSVSSAGDVNGDGYPDVIVGAELNDAGGTSAGRAYVYFGGTDATDVTADLTLTGLTGDFLGASVGAAGDVNGDGFADVIVGAISGGSGNVGLARVYLGAATPNSTADLTVAASPQGGDLGYAVASAGDVDGDGYSDIVIGDPLDDSVLSNGGKVHFVSVFPYQVLSPNGGETWVAGASTSVRWRGHDVADLAISTDGGLSYSTISNSLGGAEENELTLTAPDTPTEQAKVRLTFRGQTATRGTSDVSDGVFRIVRPAPPPLAAERLQLTPTGAASAQLGLSVSSAGDVNGDGFDDFIAGAWNVNAGAGAAYVYFGGPGAEVTADLTLSGEAAGDNFGSSVAAAGDVNRDGFDDVIVGAPRNDAAGIDAGRAYVFFGGSVPNAVADLTLTGEAAGDRFGDSVASAGDFNSDDFGDVIVGASSNVGGGANAGRAYVYYGGVASDNIVDLTFTGAVGDQLGNAVAPGGDMNGDGFGDVLVGAFAADIGTTFTIFSVGRAYVFHGGRTPDATPDLILGLTEPVSNDQFGSSVAAGDVDGDGFSDAIVGASKRDDAGLDAGAAYVFSGGPAADSNPELTLLGAAAGDGFGFPVASAGDINGDGFADIAVGAFENDAGGASAGQAYVFYGGPFGTPGGTAADFTLTGEAAGDDFGISVASAGDINGDGFDDVIAGARFNAAGGVGAGRAYLYDFNRYHVLSPNGGETWNVGGSQTISWLGAEPADVWLSVDAGHSFDRLLTDVGGSESNQLSIQVPHAPTKFAMIKVSPSDPSVTGQDVSAARFTIQASVGLLSLAAELKEDGAQLSWATEPGVGPQGLAGYRLYRLPMGGNGSGLRVGPELITQTRYTDPQGIPGTTYRLVAVNGFLEELELGRVTVEPAIAGLRAWPSPVVSGAMLNVAFPAPYVSAGYPATDLDVAVFDVRGRRVASLARGLVVPRAGIVSLAWNVGRGHTVGPGIYLVRVTAPSAGFAAERKVVVVQ